MPVGFLTSSTSAPSRAFSLARHPALGSVNSVASSVSASTDAPSASTPIGIENFWVSPERSPATFRFAVPVAGVAIVPTTGVSVAVRASAPSISSVASAASVTAFVTETPSMSSSVPSAPTDAAPVPRAWSCAANSVPPFTVVPFEYELSPASISVPAFFLMMEPFPG